MTNWASIGSQVKSIVEGIFDGTAASSVVYVTPTGTQYTLKAYVMAESLRFVREGLGYSTDAAGITEMGLLRFCFKTADITTVTGSPTLDYAGHFLLEDARYDLTEKFPGIQTEHSPLIGAVDVLTTCYVRKADALEHEIPVATTGAPMKFGNW